MQETWVHILHLLDLDMSFLQKKPYLSVMGSSHCPMLKLFHFSTRLLE